MYASVTGNRGIESSIETIAGERKVLRLGDPKASPCLVRKDCLDVADSTKLAILLIRAKAGRRCIPLLLVKAPALSFTVKARHLLLFSPSLHSTRATRGNLLLLLWNGKVNSITSHSQLLKKKGENNSRLAWDILRGR